MVSSWEHCILAVTAVVAVLAHGALCGTPPPPTFTCDGRLYVTHVVGGDGTLREVVLDNSQTSFTLMDIGPTHTGVDFNSIGYNRIDNYIYGVLPGSGQVIRLAADGSFVNFGPTTGFPVVGSYYVGDIDTNQLLWVHSPSTDIVALIDVTASPPVVVRQHAMAEDDFADWAFNPIDGRLYGYSAVRGQVFVVDAPNCVNVPLPGLGSCPITYYGPVFTAGSVGATFFDSFGRLYGYQNSPGNIFRWTVLDNPVTMTDLGSGDTISGNDGTACPGGVTFEKVVTPDSAAFDNVVMYTFTMFFGITPPVIGVEFEDILDPDMTWEAGSFTMSGAISNVVVNAYAGTNTLMVTFDTDPSAGLVVFTAEARTPPAPPANTVLVNQALLSNLPIFVVPPNGELLSDDPNQPGSNDVTTLLIELDFGDAPFETVIADNGAYHVLQGGLATTPVTLGALWDNELDGAPSFTANGDDITDEMDEDGVTIPAPFSPTVANTITVDISGEDGRLGIWIDHAGAVNSFDPVADFVVDQPITVGTTMIPITLAGSARQGLSYMRVRVFDSATAPVPDMAPYQPTGQMNSGEVEDYFIVIGCPPRPAVCTCTLPFWELTWVEPLPVAGALWMYFTRDVMLTQIAPNVTPFSDSDVEVHLIDAVTGEFMWLIQPDTLSPTLSLDFRYTPHHIFTRHRYEIGVYGTTSNCYLARLEFVVLVLREEALAP